MPQAAPWTTDAYDGLRPDLKDFLSRHPPLAQSEVLWHGGAARLLKTIHLGDELPPIDLITSVRAVVLRGDRVLVLSNKDGEHFLPGGRRELGETLIESLRREVLEETGWTIREPALVGVARFHYLGPRPPGRDYPYPDFVQVVYAAEADAELPARRLTDDYEERAELRPISDVRLTRRLPEHDLFLRAAVDRLRA